MNTKVKVLFKVGISFCLLGEPVRYDGGDKGFSARKEFLDPYVVWTPVCPEVELGMGIPREPLDLFGSDSDPKLISQTGRDWTEEIKIFSKNRIQQLRNLDLDGFLLKSSSPSCGFKSAPVWRDSKRDEREIGSGLFADALSKKWPQLPIADEQKVADRSQAEAFLDQVRHYHQSKR